MNGLINNSNACYINVVLQTLVRIPGIKEYFLYNQYREDLRSHAKMTHESLAERFGEFVKTYYAFNQKVLNASELKHCIGKKKSIFKLNTQEDAHEFLLYVVEEMSMELNRYLLCDIDHPSSNSIFCQTTFMKSWIMTCFVTRSRIHGSKMIHQEASLNPEYRLKIPISQV